MNKITTIKGLSDNDILSLFEKYRPDLSVIRIFFTERHKKAVEVKNKESGCNFIICKIAEALNESEKFHIMRYTTENIKTYIDKETNGEYSLIGECNKYNDIITIKHNTCGRTFKCRASHYVNDGGVQCKECLITKMKKTDAEVDEMIKSFGNISLHRASKYKGYHKELLIYCDDCKRTFKSSLSNLKDQYKTFGEVHCALCKKCGSVGEMHIADILSANNIHFKQEYRFPDCKDKKPLPFDFVILDESGNPIKVIEFDGKQHYDNKSVFSKNRLNVIQKHDNIKTEYCKNHNIPLLRTSQLNKGLIEIEIKKFLDI